MTRDRSSYAQQLQNADGDTAGSRESREQMLQELIDCEQQFEKKVGRMALVAWAVTLASIVLISVCSMLVRDGDATGQDVARALLMIGVATGVIALIIGLLATLTWLLRSRSPSLAAIERRLAAMEQLLKQHNKESK